MNLAELRAAFERGEIDKPTYIDRMYVLHRQLWDYAGFLAGTDLAAIEIRDGAVIMTCRSSGVRVYLNHEDQRTAPLDVLNFGAYEPEHSAMLLRLLRSGDIVYDIGANIGWYALHIARQVERARVYAFEPIPATFRQLARNVELNQANNVRPMNLGLSDRAGHLDFYFDAAISVRASSAHLVPDDNATVVRCQVRTLDEVVPETGAGLNFIKCDVEGGELLVLRGGRQVLQKYRPIVCAEMLRKWSSKFGYHPNDMILFLGELGYTCFITQGDSLVPLHEVTDATTATNYFFLHSEAHASQIQQLSEGCASA